MGNMAIRRQIMRQAKDKYKQMVSEMNERQINERLLQQGLGRRIWTRPGTRARRKDTGTAGS